MRTLDDHLVNPSNDALTITVADEPGQGGANHVYVVSVSSSTTLKVSPGVEHTITFQNGPIGEVGINGLTQEVLLAIVIDRLRSFQQGAFACNENAQALVKIEEALHWLQQRTIKRMRRGVEGTQNL
jgi:hypothetical protein